MISIQVISRSRADARAHLLRLFFFFWTQLWKEALPDIANFRLKLWHVSSGIMSAGIERGWPVWEISPSAGNFCLILFCRRALSITSDSGDERESKTGFANGAGSNKTRKLLFKKKITKVSFDFSFVSFVGVKRRYYAVLVYVFICYSLTDSGRMEV